VRPGPPAAVTATISGTPVTVNFGACSTPSTIAASLASAINGEAAPVSMTMFTPAEGGG